MSSLGLFPHSWVEMDTLKWHFHHFPQYWMERQIKKYKPRTLYRSIHYFEQEKAINVRRCGCISADGMDWKGCLNLIMYFWGERQQQPKEICYRKRKFSWRREGKVFLRKCGGQQDCTREAGEPEIGPSTWPTKIAIGRSQKWWKNRCPAVTPLFLDNPINSSKIKGRTGSNCSSYHFFILPLSLNN
jgi:hypothetical protein